MIDFWVIFGILKVNSIGTIVDHDSIIDKRIDNSTIYNFESFEDKKYS